MSEINVPKLNRTPRAMETREKDARRKPWAPPSRLDAPPAPDGFRQRWIRAEINGADDRINVSIENFREGYEWLDLTKALNSSLIQQKTVATLVSLA